MVEDGKDGIHDKHEASEDGASSSEEEEVER